MSKRLLDIVVGTVLLILVLPTMLVLALLSAMALRTWPFFTQERIGRGGRTFRLTKIRTLPPETPAYATKYELRQVRIPRICQLMRNLHLDELPQLFLVPLGAMSLVGPRPEMQTLHTCLDDEFAALRTSARPGCSGLWQIGCDAGKLINETPEYDEFYLTHSSVRLDVWILWRTALTVLGLGRPVSLADVPRWVARPTVTLAPVIDLRTPTPAAFYTFNAIDAVDA